MNKPVTFIIPTLLVTLLIQFTPSTGFGADDTNIGNFRIEFNGYQQVPVMITNAADGQKAIELHQTAEEFMR